MTLTAGELIILDQGHDGLTTPKVASEIGYPAGRIYLFFESVDDPIKRPAHFRQAYTESTYWTSIKSMAMQARIRFRISRSAKVNRFWLNILKR